MPTFSRPSYILQVLAISLLSGAVAFAAAFLVLKPESLPEPEPPAPEEPALKTEFPLGLNDDPDIEINWKEESDEYLLAIIALEETNPTIDRSPGVFFSSRANRYIGCSRMLTNRMLVRAEIELEIAARDKVLRLRSALERFADAFVEVADTHSRGASGAYRMVRLEMCDIEKRSRLEILSQLRDELDSRARLELRSQRFPTEPLAARIRQSEWYVPEDPNERAEADKAARAAQEALVATLPTLSTALAEWPPDFSQAIQTELRQWLDDYLPVPDPSTPR